MSNYKPTDPRWRHGFSTGLNVKPRFGDGEGNKVKVEKKLSDTLGNGFVAYVEEMYYTTFEHNTNLGVTLSSEYTTRGVLYDYMTTLGELLRKYLCYQVETWNFGEKIYKNYYIAGFDIILSPHYTFRIYVEDWRGIDKSPETYRNYGLKSSKFNDSWMKGELLMDGVELKSALLSAIKYNSPSNGVWVYTPYFWMYTFMKTGNLLTGVRGSYIIRKISDNILRIFDSYFICLDDNAGIRKEVYPDSYRDNSTYYGDVIAGIMPNEKNKEIIEKLNLRHNSYVAVDNPDDVVYPDKGTFLAEGFPHLMSQYKIFLGDGTYMYAEKYSRHGVIHGLFKEGTNEQLPIG